MQRFIFMILPTTYLAALLLSILTMICWGSWANTQKFSGKWRFELFYYDYALGLFLTAIVLAFTFGTLGTELTFMDSLAISGKKQIAFALAGGVIFNLANMLLVAAIAVAGLSVAFPVGIGLALVIGVIWNFILNPQGNPYYLFTGAAIVGIAIVVDAMAYSAHAKDNAPPPPPGKKKRQGSVSAKGIVLCCASGILMGSFYPLVELAKQGEIGLGPYAVGFIFALGVFLSTFVFNLYFMNLPVQGERVMFSQYFRGTAKQHMLGILGGAIWCIGGISNFVAASAPPQVNVGPAVSYALGQGATLISALWGLFYWHEFKNPSPKVKQLLTLMLVLFVVGLALVSIAPLR
jgi:glucose uptake protein